MRYIFFGSAEFSLIVLQKLINAGMMPVAVVCNPDRPVGRKKIITPPLVKTYAQEHGITILQPEKVTPEIFAPFEDIDCFVIASYSKILSQVVLDVPKVATVGVHPSLLPKYRGSTPIQTVIAEGIKETGVSLFVVDDKVDHGPIIAQSSPVSVDLGYYRDLETELALVGGDLLVETLPKLVAGTAQFQIQNESEATLTKKLKTEDGFVPFDELKSALVGDLDKAAIIERKIRAYTPEPGVWTQIVEPAKFGEIQIENKRVKLLEAIVSADGLAITQLQIEGELPRRV